MKLLKAAGLVFAIWSTVGAVATATILLLIYAPAWVVGGILVALVFVACVSIALELVE